MAKFTSTAFKREQKQWLDRANRAIAQGALTNSKRPQTFVKGVYPTHIDKTVGSISSYKDAKWVDFVCSLGSNLFGQANPYINQAVIKTINEGNSFSLSSTLEVEAAERAQTIWPELERLKFFKNGTDATTAALRVARAYRGCELVLSAGYHGSSDDFVSLTPPALGVPSREWIKTLGELENLPKVAAIIVEPLILKDDSENREWLAKLRLWCDKTGTVLIFDEIITGFRVPKLSVSNYYGIKPDLACYGKAIANGFSISIMGGRSEIMECGEYFVSNTFSGERCGLAAFVAASDLILNPNQNNGKSVDDLWSHAKLFWNDVNAVTEGVVTFSGYPTRGRIEGTALNKALFMQECCKGGVLFGPSYFYNFTHFQHDQMVLSVIKSVIKNLKMGLVQLEGEMPASPFADKLRGNNK
jgi:glutamate-1-semialdehyde 2,1-aminomutase